MKSRTTDRFWKWYALLPADTKKRAKEAYKHFMKDPYHPGLHYKRVHSSRPIFSVSTLQIQNCYKKQVVLLSHSKNPSIEAASKAFCNVWFFGSSAETVGN